LIKDIIGSYIQATSLILSIFWQEKRNKKTELEVEDFTFSVDDADLDMRPGARVLAEGGRCQ
jgi:hypothetical protein